MEEGGRLFSVGLSQNARAPSRPSWGFAPHAHFVGILSWGPIHPVPAGALDTRFDAWTSLFTDLVFYCRRVLAALYARTYSLVCILPPLVRATAEARGFVTSFPLHH